MRQYEFEAAGWLQDPDARSAVESALTALHAGEVDATVLAGLHRLDSLVPDKDPDAGFVRLVVAQVSTAYFETTQRFADSEPALDAARSLAEFDSLPDWLCSYEHGRTAYQVGKLLGDPVLMEEAVHFYDEARNRVGARSGRGRELRRYLREAAGYRHAFADQVMRNVVVHGLAAARFDLPLDAFPAVGDCRRPRGVLRRLRKRPEPFFCLPLGVPSQARFWWSGKVKSLQRRRDELDPRGRRTTGHFTAMETDTNQLVNQMSLMMWLGTRDGDGAVDVLRDRATELYEWAERVSRWADVVTGRMPKLGFQVMTRYLYGDLLSPEGSRRLVINADEPGITWELRLRPGEHINRYELSYVLNRLVLHEVPIAIEMLQMAEYSLLNDQPRQAVIEAGTAAEAALSVLYDSYPTTLPREAPNQRSWTLGTLVSKAHKVGILPPGDNQAVLQRELVAPRNDAVHRGHATRAQAMEVIEAARRIVDYTFGTGSQNVVVLDQRMRQMGPLLSPRPAARSGFPTPDSDGR